MLRCISVRATTSVSPHSMLMSWYLSGWSQFWTSFYHLPTPPQPPGQRWEKHIKELFCPKLSFLGLSICPACAISSNDTQVMRKTQNTMKVFERFNCTVNLKVKGFIQVFLCYFLDQKSVSANSYTFCNYGTQHHLNTSTDAFWLLFIKTNRIWPSSSPMWWYARYVQGVECNIIKKRLAFILDMMYNNHVISSSIYHFWQ